MPQGVTLDEWKSALYADAQTNGVLDPRRLTEDCLKYFYERGVKPEVLALVNAAEN